MYISTCIDLFTSVMSYTRPRPFRFRTGKGLGYSAHFIGSTLVVETVGKGGQRKAQTQAVEFVFQSYQVHTTVQPEVYEDTGVQC